WDGKTNSSSDLPIAGETRSADQADRVNATDRANEAEAYASQQGWLNESNTIQMVNQSQSPNRVIPWQSTWSLAPAAASFATPDVHPSGSPLFDSLYQESYKKLRRVQSTSLTPSMNNSIQLVGAQRP
ncbi:MAG: hypothetical protein O2991_05010, partial [Bacteroidetes bacterium]|nr:hypothetical protein [Bacteroidota bacterium]